MAKRSVQDKYGFCHIDGQNVAVRNFRIKKPRLICTGIDTKNPNIGKIYPRIKPEDVTIVCSEDSVFPEAPEGHAWKAISHDRDAVDIG